MAPHQGTSSARWCTHLVHLLCAGVHDDGPEALAGGHRGDAQAFAVALLHVRAQPLSTHIEVVPARPMHSLNLLALISTNGIYMLTLHCRPMVIEPPVDEVQWACWPANLSCRRVTALRRHTSSIAHLPTVRYWALRTIRRKSQGTFYLTPHRPCIS